MSIEFLQKHFNPTQYTLVILYNLEAYAQSDLVQKMKNKRVNTQ